MPAILPSLFRTALRSKFDRPSEAERARAASEQVRAANSSGPVRPSGLERIERFGFLEFSRFARVFSVLATQQVRLENPLSLWRDERKFRNLYIYIYIYIYYLFFNKLWNVSRALARVLQLNLFSKNSACAVFSNTVELTTSSSFQANMCCAKDAPKYVVVGSESRMMAGRHSCGSELWFP